MQPGAEQDDDRQHHAGQLGEVVAGEVGRSRAPGSERNRSITPSVRSVAIDGGRTGEPEGQRLDEDAADDVLAVAAAVDRDRAAEHVREQQHEHQRLDRDVEQLLGDLADVLDVAAGEHERVAPARAQPVLA